MARKAMIKLPGFGGVDTSGGSFHIPPGDYAMKCTGVTQEVSKADNEMLVFRFIGTEGKAKGRGFRLHCTFGENALWKLGQTLQALGVEIEDDPTTFDPDDVVDIEVIGTVADNEYDGKINSRLNEIRASDVEDEADDAKPATKAKATASNGNSAATTKNKKGPVKMAASEVEDMAEDELFEINEKYDLGVDLDAHKTTRKKANAVIAALQSAKMLEA